MRRSLARGNEQRKVAIRHQKIMFLERTYVPVHALSQQRAEFQVAPVSWG